MTAILDRIADYKRREVAEFQSACNMSEVERAALSMPPARGFEAALRRAAQDGHGLVAEIKKASPSKGLIREDFDPPALAKSYEAGGATCLSVLTDTRSFQGSSEDLRGAANAVALPSLRKDFIIDPCQVAQSRSYGADCILLILAMIDNALAAEIESEAFNWGMDVLLEVHDEDELERAERLESNLLGINNRDLKTFEVSLDTSCRLARLAPAGSLIVSESGIATRSDIESLKEFGVGAFLVGESLMRQQDLESATRALAGAQPCRRAEQ